MWMPFLPFALSPDAAMAESAGAGALPTVPDARFALALYCNPTCDDRVLDDLDAALSAIHEADEFAEHVATPERIMGIGGTDFGIPDEEFVAQYGQGVGDAAALGRSEEVVLAWFAGPREQSVQTFATAHAAFAAAAHATGGWVEDLDTQSLFGAEAWAARSPAGSMQDWFVVEQEPMAEGSERLRLITRGLRRYGDFELVVEDVGAEDAGDVAYALDAIATSVHPLAEIPPEVRVDGANARGTARFEVATPRDGDTTDGILRARFSGEILLDEAAAPTIAAEASLPPGPGGSPAGAASVTVVTPAAASSGSSTPEGTPPAAPQPPAPTSLAEARSAVRSALVTLESVWQSGLPSGDVLAVSAPFSTRSGGTEYLWVEVRHWSGSNITGRLATEPSQVAGLRVGDEVTLRTEEVFDYVYKHADGRKDGNLTRPFR